MKLLYMLEDRTNLKDKVFSVMKWLETNKMLMLFRKFK